MKIEDVELDHVYEFLERGSISNAPEHIVAFLDLIDKIRGMYLRIDVFGNAEAIVKHLVLVDKLPRMKAKRIFEQALEYFYCESHISKKAWRNILAEKMEKMLNYVILTAKDSADAKRAVDICKEIGIMRGVHEPDKEELPQELFTKPYKVYTIDAAELGMAKANRNNLKALIEKLPDLTEKEKTRLKQEADIDGSFKIFPDEQEDPRKS